MEHRIEVKSVTKRFRKNTVLNNVSCCFSSGRCTGIVGVNGSGKTMLMRMIVGLILPDQGKVIIDEKELHKDIFFPENCGLLLEAPAFVDSFTGFDNLKMLASINGKVNDKEIKRYISMVGLNPDDTKKYRKYSLGMKQRLGIAAAIFESPDIVILDEPTNALDKNGVKLVKSIINEQKERGAIVIIASHDSAIISELADNILFMSEGQLVSNNETMVVNDD